MTDAQPEFVANSWAAGGLTVTYLYRGVRWSFRRVRARHEVRCLNRIGVLQPGWDVGGRHRASAWRADLSD